MRGKKAKAIRAHVYGSRMPGGKRPGGKYLLKGDGEVFAEKDDVYRKFKQFAMDRGPEIGTVTASMGRKRHRGETIIDFKSRREKSNARRREREGQRKRMS